MWSQPFIKNGLTLRRGVQRIRPNSKIKIPAPPLLLLFFDVSRQKIVLFIVWGTLQLHAVCPTTNFRKLWMTAFHHTSFKTSVQKLSKLTVCSSSPSFVVVTQTIPEIFDRECLGNYPIFSSSTHTISQNLVSRDPGSG